MEQENSLVIVGSVAIDWVITPKSERSESIGGSAVYASMAAAPHASVKLVGVTGKDFPDQAVSDFRGAGIDLSGLEMVSDGLTFRWKGRYHENMNQRDTLETHLNCFEHFDPKLPESYRNSDYLFLGNIQPSLQLSVLNQMAKRPKVVALDTMNLWIDIATDELREVLAHIDILIINEEESMQLSGEGSILTAARVIQNLGPKVLVIKRGEYGALLFGPEPGEIFSAPGLPLDPVVDPTGAGDCFAGGFMGHLARTGNFDSETLRRAVIEGSVTASFCVEGFSYDKLRGLDPSKIRQRYQNFIDITKF